jgi:hypothetical protein
LAAELLQGRHVSELTSALNLVVYGVKGTQRRTNAAAATAAAQISRWDWTLLSGNSRILLVHGIKWQD